MVNSDYIDLPNKSLLRPDEVATFMRVCVKTVYRWCELGKLQGVNLGKTLRIYRKSVIELLEKSGTDENAITEEVYKWDTNPRSHLTLHNSSTIQAQFHSRRP
jgi:excisionase family DNA binding protein